jgi:hypothetical protein
MQDFTPDELNILMQLTPEHYTALAMQAAETLRRQGNTPYTLDMIDREVLRLYYAE